MSSVLVLPERLLAVRVLIKSMPVAICNCSHARLVVSSRNSTFEGESLHKVDGHVQSTL